MTNWDKIYQDFIKDGDAWATLSEDVHPLFGQFLQKSIFKKKHALDIGCGTGKYALFLLSNNFTVDGIDSSPTAIRMTKKLLGKNIGKIELADMFEFQIPNNSYDLIISISTIHHGMKKDVQHLINKIHSALMMNGKIFITIPNYNKTDKLTLLRDNNDLGDGTFAPLLGPEKGIPHSLYTKTDVQKLFTKFSNIKISLDNIDRWIIQADK